MKQVTGGTSFGTNATAPPVRLGFTFSVNAGHAVIRVPLLFFRGQDNSPVRPATCRVVPRRVVEPKKEINLASHGTPVGHLPISACPTARFRKRFLKIPRRIFYVSRPASVTLASSGDHPLDRCSFQHILISSEERTITRSFLNRLRLFDSFVGK